MLLKKNIWWVLNYTVKTEKYKTTLIVNKSAVVVNELSIKAPTYLESA